MVVVSVKEQRSINDCKSTEKRNNFKELPKYRIQCNKKSLQLRTDLDLHVSPTQFVPPSTTVLLPVQMSHVV